MVTFGAIALICLAVFLLLYGIKHATNVEIIWMEPLTALAALVAGVILMIQAIMGLV